MNDLFISLIYIIPFISAGYIFRANMIYQNWCEMGTMIALAGMIGMTLLGHFHTAPLDKNATLCIMFQLGITIMLGFLSLRQPARTQISPARYEC